MSDIPGDERYRVAVAVLVGAWMLRVIMFLVDFGWIETFAGVVLDAVLFALHVALSGYLQRIGGSEFGNTTSWTGIYYTGSVGSLLLLIGGVTDILG